MCNCSIHEGVALWCYVTGITQHEVTQSWKQTFRRLWTVLERWPDQTLCAHVFTLCFPYIMTWDGLPLYWVFWGVTQKAWPRLHSYSRGNMIYVRWQRRIQLQHIPLLLSCCLLSLTLILMPIKHQGLTTSTCKLVAPPYLCKSRVRTDALNEMKTVRFKITWLKKKKRILSFIQFLIWEQKSPSYSQVQVNSEEKISGLRMITDYRAEKLPMNLCPNLTQPAVKGFFD